MAKLSKKEKQVLNRIEDLGEDGRFFSVEFVKKDGSDREMVARLGVNYNSKTGEGMGWDPISRGYLPVYDVQKEDFRMVTLDTVRKLKGRGVILEKKGTCKICNSPIYSDSEEHMGYCKDCDRDLRSAENPN